MSGKEENMREFIVEVNIIHPNGESLDDWRHVASMTGDISEQSIKADCTTLGKNIAKKVEAFCTKNEVVSAPTEAEKAQILAEAERKMKIQHLGTTSDS